MGTIEKISISPDAPLEEFAAIAPEHPVFRVLEQANAL
jgi:hypothetical protein